MPPRPSAKRPRSLPDRLDDRNIADPITTYREGAPATAHGLVPRVSSASCTSSVSPDITHSTSYEGNANRYASAAVHARRSPRTQRHESALRVGLRRDHGSTTTTAPADSSHLPRYRTTRPSSLGSSRRRLDGRKPSTSSKRASARQHATCRSSASRCLRSAGSPPPSSATLSPPPIRRPSSGQSLRPPNASGDDGRHHRQQPDAR